MARTNGEIKCEVVKVIAVLSEKEYDRTNWKTKEKEHVKETRELRIVKWNDGAPKYDIRDWYEVDGEETCGKGISLSDEEWTLLQYADVSMMQTA